MKNNEAVCLVLLYRLFYSDVNSGSQVSGGSVHMRRLARTLAAR